MVNTLIVHFRAAIDNIETISFKVTEVLQIETNSLVTFIDI